MSLVTQILILLTALVGLVKVSRAHVTSPSAGDVASPVKALLTLLLSFGVFLFIPGVVLAFTWIMKNVESLNNSMSESTSPAQASVSSLVAKWQLKESPALAIVRAADAAQSYRTRDSLLAVAGRAAAATGAHHEAVIAVQAIAGTTMRDSALVSLVPVVLKAGRFELATSIVEQISSTRLKDETSRNVVRALEAAITRPPRVDSAAPKPK